MAKVREYRICSECGKKMYEGYCIENGEAWYCSDECLHKHMTEEEYLELYDDGDGDSYWTEWESMVDEEEQKEVYGDSEEIVPCVHSRKIPTWCGKHCNKCGYVEEVV